MANAGKSDPSVADKLAALKRAFHQQLSGKLADIKTLCDRLTQSKISTTELNELHRLVHGLSGSAGTFGAIAIGNRARELEILIKPIALGEREVNPDSFKMMEEILQNLGKAIVDWDPDQSPLSPEKISSQVVTGHAELVYLLEDDELLAAELIAKLEVDEHYQVRHFIDSHAFLSACEDEMPQVILMDMILATGAEAGAETITILNKRHNNCPPVIFISIRKDIQARLEAARAGARRYFTKPLDMDKLLDTLDGLTSRRPEQPYRILLVDDDKTLLEYYSTVLKDAGMRVKAINDPLVALDVLDEFLPDMMVVDVYMPDCSGPELAQVIRQDDHFAQMPIMFLSTETNLDKQLAAMHLGGDDFLTKPVDADHLIEAVLARVKRTRWVRRLNSNLEDALRESEYRHITLDQHSIVSVADVTGNITFVNEKFCDASGYSREELVGKNHRILKSSEHDDAFYKSLWSTISSGKVWHGVICNKAKDGSKYWVSSTIVPFLDSQGKPYQYMAARTDITELKKGEQQAIEAKHELEAQQKLLLEAKEEADSANRAKSQFLSSMSHELRTPLNAILGFSQLMQMQSDHPLSKMQMENLAEIINAGKHLLELINGVLDLAKIESGTINLSIESVMLGDVLSECVGLVYPLAQKRNIELTVSGEGKIYAIDEIKHINSMLRADRTRFKQVFLNLLSNAIKYNHEYGQISVDCMTTDTNCHITISDTGAGITDAMMENLFTPFNRLGAEQSSVEGTGIGLVITKNLVELMHGEIGVETRVGKGTTFWIDMPADREEQEQRPEIDSANINTGTDGEKADDRYSVLYIEDNPANLRLVEHVFTRRPHLRLLSAHEPMLGLELASEYRPNLILLDINLPGMSGFDVLTHLRQRADIANIPVVAVSANAMPRDIKKGMDAGFNDYITKPINVNTLLDVVDEYVVE